VFSGVLLLAYAVVPAAVYLTILPERVFLQLALITVVGVGALVIGAHLPVFDTRFVSQERWLNIDWRLFVGACWLAFVAFVVITFATAPTIPIISVLQGASAEALSQERGEFLKGRAGPAILLLYVGAFMVNTLVPYTIVIAYAARSRLRHLFALAFFLFCVSFLQKALFLNMVLPLTVYFAMKGKLGGFRAALGIAGSVLVLIAATYLSLGEGGPTDVGEAMLAADILSAAFKPANAMEYFLWRAFAVPVFTATDTLVVHASYFDARPLWGATSSFLAALFGFERVNLERFVFEYQFGGWNDLANSNTVFLVDGFVNFGWVGVVSFGLSIGQLFRWFRFSRDVGFRSLWLLVAFVLFSSPLIGFLLGNGFLYMLGHALLVRMRARNGPILLASERAGT
jgi:hypothetical protein